jgi:hypothetical protein
MVAKSNQLVWENLKSMRLALRIQLSGWWAKAIQLGGGSIYDDTRLLQTKDTATQKEG